MALVHRAVQPAAIATDATTATSGSARVRLTKGARSSELVNCPTHAYENQWYRRSAPIMKMLSDGPNCATEFDSPSKKSMSG